MSSSDLVPAAVRDACRHARESFSLSSFRGREETGTHLLRIRGYSTVNKKLGRGMFVESRTFRAGGHSWNLEYHPSGLGDHSKSGSHASVVLRHKGISFLAIGKKLLGDKAGAMAEWKVSILDRHGNQVYGYSSSPCHFTRPGKANRFNVMEGTDEEPREKLRLAEEDTLFVKCDVRVHKVERESIVKFLLQRLLAD